MWISEFVLLLLVLALALSAGAWGGLVLVLVLVFPRPALCLLCVVAPLPPSFSAPPLAVVSVSPLPSAPGFLGPGAVCEF